MGFSFMSGLVQLISLLMFLLLVGVLLNVLQYVKWKKKHDLEIGRKLDKILEQLAGDKAE